MLCGSHPGYTGTHAWHGTAVVCVQYIQSQCRQCAAACIPPLHGCQDGLEYCKRPGHVSQLQYDTHAVIPSKTLKVCSGQILSGLEMDWWSAGPILESTGGSASLTSYLCRGVCRHDHTLPPQEEDWVLCDPDLPTLHYDGHPVPGLLLA